MAEWIEESFFMRAPQDGLCVTHNGHLPLAPFPEGIPRLEEARLQPGFLLLAKLRDAAGEVVGFASEFEEVLPDSDIGAGTLRTRTLWTLFLMGRGSITFDEIENNSLGAQRMFAPALVSGEPWEGEWTVISTVGPGPDGRGVIEGGTREFHGIEGSAQEVSYLRRFDPAHGQLDLDVELRLRYRLLQRAPAEFELPAAQTIAGGPGGPGG
jgi:hypothetical protein